MTYALTVQIARDLRDLSECIDSYEDDAQGAAVQMAQLVSGSLDGDDPNANYDPSRYADIYLESIELAEYFRARFVALVNSLSSQRWDRVTERLANDAAAGRIPAERALYRMRAMGRDTHVSDGTIDPPAVLATT